MNWGGHIVVASLAAGDDAGMLLGSALPDLAAMGGFRLLGATGDREVARGIRIHHRTDDAFHGHPWFTEHNRRLRTELLEAGVDRGPARACSHVGLELLLDGVLLADGNRRGRVADAFAAIDGRRAAMADLVVGPERVRWGRHLVRLGQVRRPVDFDDPDAVALRLHRILSRRPRLSLPDDHIERVAEALGRYRPLVEDRTESLVVELAATVAAT